MPDNIEKTIYKLELDGSAYIDGVNNLTASTNKLTASQDAANKKLLELKNEQILYKKQIADIDIILKENEKDTLELTKRLNDLKAAEKGSSVEAKNLQNQLRSIAISTKEFRIESAALKTNLAGSTAAITTQTKELAKFKPAGAQAVEGVSKVYGGLRILANIIPGLGVGGLISLIAGPLVDAISSWVSSLTDVNTALNTLKANQQNVNEVMAEAGKSAGKEIADLKILYKTATDVTLSIEDRRKAVASLQAEFPDYFKNVSAETIMNGKAKTSYDELTLSILATSRATAAKGKLDQLEAQQLEQDFNKQKVINATNNEFARAAKASGTTSQGAGFGGRTVIVSPEQNRKILTQQIQDRKDARLKEIEENKKSLQDQEDFLIKFAGLTNIAKVIEDKDKKTITKSRKDVENVYIQELQKLKADISKLSSTTFTTEATITKAVEEDFKMRENAFIKAFKNKQLTSQQLASLKEYLNQLEKITLTAQLDAFKKQKQNYLQAISDEITSLQLEESTKRIQSIQDSFERERQTILLESQKTISALQRQRDAEIDKITKSAPASGLTAADVAGKIAEIKQIYSKLFDDLIIIKNQKLEQLDFDVFEKLRDDAKKTLDSENLGISQGSLFRIKQESDLLEKGKISFKEYQQSLTEIAKNETQERFIVQKRFLVAEIQVRALELKNNKSLTDEQIVRLKDEIRKLEQELADAEKGNIITTNNGNNKKKIDEIKEYANAIGKVIDSVIKFWQASNDAEQKALDRSITLQEKRVDAAQRLADKGNASYLKAEIDKLKELNVARENAARKQLGIDAALQASQILVGITGAISKIATPGIGAAEVIGEIGIIIGALATGYGLVKQLQSNQVQLYEGTKYVSRNGHPTGIDTIPARLTEGEAVIPVKTNKAYSETVGAIYDGSIPPEELNGFVKSYHKLKPVAKPDFERIKEATELKISHDGKMSIILSEQNNLIKENTEYQKQTLKAIRSMGVNVNVDRHGFAMSFLEVFEQNNRDKRC